MASVGFSVYPPSLKQRAVYRAKSVLPAQEYASPSVTAARLHLQRSGRRVAARRVGRWILLCATYLDESSPRGLHVVSTDFDIVPHPKSTCGLLQFHVIAHEHALILLGYAGMTTAASAAGYAHAILVPNEILSNIAPDVTPALIRQLLSRTIYEDMHEC